MFLRLLLVVLQILLSLTSWTNFKVLHIRCYLVFFDTPMCVHLRNSILVKILPDRDNRAKIKQELEICNVLCTTVRERARLFLL